MLSEVLLIIFVTLINVKYFYITDYTGHHIQSKWQDVTE